ncbi:hypothetical protein LIER_12273 [Lithospermum erythrorhizon]|uniref:Reverse transcriptase Ty1/copia-type domain-containing protein n=1 Tax=Lithospermum erythrorhizon TaxID=34254 RepID=A0AAV3PR33_LITER
MQSEIDALEQNNTWELVTLPVRKRPIGCNWVYKVKYKPNGEVDKYKARLVPKGYDQIEGYLDEDIYMKPPEGYEKATDVQDLGMAKYFLGIEIARSSTGMYISQRKYITDIIQDMKLEGSKVVSILLFLDWTPYNPDSPLHPYLQTFVPEFSRHDITYSLQTLSQFMQSPTMYPLSNFDFTSTSTSLLRRSPP